VRVYGEVCIVFFFSPYQIHYFAAYTNFGSDRILAKLAQSYYDRGMS
jgi:hypothetical protein